MPAIITWAPGTVVAGTNIDLPSGSPPIRRIYGATLFRGSDGTVAATEVTVSATRVDKNTITLDVDTTTRDLLTLRYEIEFEKVRP